MAVGRERRNLLPRRFSVCERVGTLGTQPRIREFHESDLRRALPSLPLPHPPLKSHPSSRNLDFQIYHLATDWLSRLVRLLFLLPNGSAHVTSSGQTIYFRKSYVYLAIYYVFI